MKYVRLLLMPLLLAMSSQAWSAEFFDLSFGDFEEELALARDEGKQGVFVFYEMDDCPFCQRMRETILVEPKVITYFRQHFSNHAFDILGGSPVVDFDGTEYDTGKEMAEKKYRVRATPVMIIFDLEGKPIARFTGPARNKEELILFGEYAISGSYKEMPFTRYKRAQSK